MVDLSIIIPSYNTVGITKQCIESIVKLIDSQPVTIEIIVVDNASSDNTITEIQILKIKYQNDKLKFKIIQNNQNIGFARANNQGVKETTGKYILFLNSDVIIDKIDFKELVQYFEKNDKIGALTVKINLKKNGIDPASHRGFPTLWRSFCYFSGLEKLLGGRCFLKKVFGGYHLLNNDLETIHEIDSPSGAFFLTRKELLNKLKGFDEEFFMYGEDLDLAYRIKEQGYRIIYYPKWMATHLKYQSGLQKDQKTRAVIKEHFYKAMKIFYKKHYDGKYPWPISQLVYLLIDIKQKLS